ncbi:MAG: S8 family serine peptidase [Oscillospiraceae bacterium]|nr:S8 family serine peptidase [Oscillospiraceae bacterium]
MKTLIKLKTWALTIAVLVSMVIATPPMVLSAEVQDDMILDFAEIDLTPIEPSDLFLGNNGFLNKEAVYVRSVAEALTHPMGLVGYEDTPDDQELHVFIWLQELPDALDKVYQSEIMSVAGFSAAQTDAQTAREKIRNLGGMGASARSRTAPAITITFEYFEVFAGFAVKAPKDVVEQIGEMPGVYMITEVGYYELYSTDYKPDPGYDIPGNAGAREAWGIGDLHTDGIDGRGVKVGVIDSGIQANHPDIAGAYKGGWNFTNGLGGNSANMSYPDGNHGIHVAGTIASQGEKSLGIAPGADIYMAQVFADESSTNSGAGDVVMAAIESFTKGVSYTYTQNGIVYTPNLPAVDVINMSLGVPLDHPSQEAQRNTAYEAGQFARNNAVVDGVVVVASAGNSAYYDSRTYTEFQGTRNPYTITSGGASLPISVAASMYGGNPTYEYNAEVSDALTTGTIHLLVESSDRILSGVFQSDGFANSNLTPVADNGYELQLCMTGVPAAGQTVTTEGMLEAIPNDSLDGKILVVGRGIDFTTYKDHALRTGAGGLIVVNRDSTFIDGMTINDTASDELAIFSAPVEAAATLLDLKQDDPIYLNPGKRINIPAPKETTTFSSIGPVRETAEIKPDVIAPGYAILSTSLENGYATAQGTSMSAPAVTGVVALILQQNPTATPAEVKARLMNTADPFLISPNSTNNAVYNNSPYYFNASGTQTSVYEQGAGFVNPTRAIHENTYITVENTVPTNNVDKSAQTADMASFSFGVTAPDSTTDKLTATVHGASISSVEVIYRNDTRFSKSSAGAVTVRTELKGNIFDVWLEISPNASTDPKAGNLYEGYIKVTVSGQEYHLPWATRVGESHSETFEILGIAERPIVSTSLDSLVRSAGDDNPRNSNATSLYYTWWGEMPSNPRFNGSPRAFGLYLLDVKTNSLAYYYGGWSANNPVNNGGSWSVIRDVIAGTARPIIGGSIQSDAVPIQNGAYYLVMQTGHGYSYYSDIGVVFTDGLGDMAVQLTIDGLDENGRLPVSADERVTTAEVTGRIFSPALDLAATHGFLWTDYNDFRSGRYFNIDQSYNVLACSSQEDTYGEIQPGGEIGSVGVILNGGHLWYCDEDGYFGFTRNVMQAEKDGGYLFTSGGNPAIVGVEGFYYNYNGASRPFIGANKSSAITPTYKLDPEPEPNPNPDPNPDPDPNPNPEPNPNPTPTPTPSDPTTTSPTTTEPAPETTPSDYIEDNVIFEALEADNPVIDLKETDSTIISADMLQAIAESGKDVDFILDNGFKFTILSDSISPDAGAFDLNIDIYLTNQAESIDGVKISANSIIVNPNFTGEFGFEIRFEFTAAQLKEKGINGNNVKLFHVDHDRKITDMGKVKLNADGSVEFTISHASYYILAEDVSEDVAIDISITDATDETAAGARVDGNENPATGVAVGFTAAIIAGGAVVLSKKSRKCKGLIKG